MNAKPRSASSDNRRPDEYIGGIWGDDAVSCSDNHEGRTVWHHRNYHDAPAKHSLSIRWRLFRLTAARELRYLLVGR